MLKPIPQLLSEIRPSIKCVTAAEARAQASTQQAILIDVREPAEAEAQPSPNTLNIPRGILEMKLSATYPDPEKVIYIHCATGARALLAAEQLQRIGYVNVAAITCDLETICSD